MTLLAPGDPFPTIIENRGAASPFLLLGDHAGRHTPNALDGLGVAPAEFDRHIAWDIGVASVGAALAAALGAPFISQVYSRLVIDCNRDPRREDSIPVASDGVTITGNVGLTADDRRNRVEAIHKPYHATIAQVLNERQAAGLSTIVVALHSFTPAMAGKARPWLFGVLHRDDSPFSRAVLTRLRAQHGEAAGDNEPYRMDEVDYTVPHHAIRRGLDYLELEIRQDQVGDEDDQRRVAAMLADLLPAALGDLGR